MFEDICLMCGKGLQDTGRAYCSDECQSSDSVSPSISSSSSALSSPSLGCAQGSEVPPLVPSALGFALRQFQAHDSHYVSSSSASSNSWTLATDDDDDDEDPPFSAEKKNGSRDGVDSIDEGNSTSANFLYSMMPSALSYTRRPSGINHHSTIPQVHQRSPSGDSSAPAPNRTRGRGTPRSVPNPSQSSSTTDEDEEFTNSSFSSQNVYSTSSADHPLKHSSVRQNRNRGSLPSFFTLLQVKSTSKEAIKSSPVLSSSSSNTALRPSPPTPKTFFPSQNPVDIALAPRGRRQRQSDSSPSRSRSRHLRHVHAGVLNPNVSRVNNKGSVERPVFDWDPANLSHGRTSLRRNSSPPPRPLMGVEDPAMAVTALRDAERAERSQSEIRTRGRGRIPAHELEGVGSLSKAPGFGNGRSGLLDRGRIAAMAKRVPL